MVMSENSSFCILESNCDAKQTHYLHTKAEEGKRDWTRQRYGDALTLGIFTNSKAFCRKTIVEPHHLMGSELQDCSQVS